MTFASTTKRRCIALWGLALLIPIWLSSAAAWAQDTSWSQVLTEIEAERADYARELADFERHRDQFLVYVDEVEALKDERAGASALANDAEVRAALRQAHEMATSLQARADALRLQATELRQLEDVLLGELQQRIDVLEDQLRTSPTGERGAVLGELTALTELRADYLEPLPDVPEIQLDAILLGLDDAATPEELLATAEELSDHERRLRDYLDELEDHIRQLDLRRRERSFRSEASVFEEGASSGRREPSSAGTQSEAGARTTETGDNGGGGATVNNTPGFGGAGVEDEPATTPNEDNQSPSSDAEFAGDDPTDGAPDDGLSGGGGAGNDADGASREDPPTVDVQVPDLAEPSLRPVAQPQDDPTIFFGQGGNEVDGGERSGSTRGRLEQLQLERDEALRTLDQIRRQRLDLLERVDELEAAEGF